VKSTFATFDKDIDKVELMKDKESGKFYGVAFVKFKDPEVAKRAVDVMSGIQILGRPISVQLKSQQPNAKRLKTSDGTTPAPKEADKRLPNDGTKLKDISLNMSLEIFCFKREISNFHSPLRLHMFRMHGIRCSIVR
jgi:RNA recognition motif-containing protein